ncbi:MAG TPA: carboxypeptidase regulatory-like domain-containing protein [Blastocatellia bacterium]|nr:carboxypeptidase regulatory-like domain-containing protein [Blastocatellia bacterium]
MKRKITPRITVLSMILLLVANAIPVFGQTSRGTVTGVVTDPQGAVIAGATAELTNKQTNQTRTTTTNDAGIYRFDAVDLGIYDLKITAQGFKAYTATGIEIQANRIATFDVRLETGGTEVVVEVNAGTEEILQKSDAVRGGNFDHRQVTQLPTATNNPYNLAQLLPGVTRPAGTTGFGNGTDLSINGARPRGNNFLLDGVENNDISIGGPAFQPSNEDQVREVSVQTGLYSAEFGRAGGGVFNQVTNSGTNQYHGTVGWKLHSQVFDALTNGDRLNGLKEPAVFTENNFTATFGGPIFKDKTFFFGAGQWYRFRSTGNTGFTVPTAAGRARLRQLFPQGTNPRVDLYLQAWEGVVGVTSITNIPLGRGPNGVDRGSIEFGQAPVTIPTKSDDNNYAVRIDHTFTEAHRLSGRYLYDHSPVTPNGVNGPGFFFDGDFGSQNLLATHTWVINPTMTNEFRFSFGRINFQFPISPNAIDLANTLPNIAISGISPTGIQTNIPQFRIANNYLFQETMSKVWSTHTFRFGGEYLRQVAEQHPPFNERGSFSFVAGGGFSAFANFIDNFSGFRGTANINFGDPIYHPNLNRVSAFFQDTWKTTPNLTLTLGLRYENFGQPANSAFKFPAINLDPATFLTPNKVKQDNNNFGPVIGFAWTPHFESGILGMLFGVDKTVWRGGYQVSYDTFFNNLLSNIAADSPNTIATTNVDVSPGSAATSRGTANWFPNAIPKTARVPTPLDTQTSLFNPNIRNPYTQRFSLGMQRQLPWKMLLDTSYVGSLGRKLFVTEDVNPLIGTARRIPTLGIRRMRTNGANSSYNSLQVRVDKAFSHGFLINTSYTWSKFIDNTSEVFATTNSGSSLASVPVFQGGLRLDRAVSDYDRPHRLVISYIWNLPGPRTGLLGSLVGGWQISGVTTFQSGAPFTIVNGVDRNGDGVNGLDRPDIGNPNAPHNTRAQIVATSVCSTGLRNPDTGACVTANDVFVVQGVGFPTARTLGRNTERSKAVNNFDMFFFKNFRFKEQMRLEYRLEAFNIFNHPQFTGVPGRSVAGTAAKQFFDFNLLNGGGRTMRMGLKFIF